jgi:hypothetical protein
LNWDRVNITLARLASVVWVYGVFHLTGMRSPGWWTAGGLTAVALLLLAPAARRRVTRSRWPYRLYRLRRDQALADAFHLPRRPGPLERLYLRVRPPRWCKTDDLMLVYGDREKLLGEGTIVPAVLVQGNVVLFGRGADDAPANVLYTTDREAEQAVPRMLAVAQRLFSLKNTKPEDADEARFARMVSYELGRDFRVTVPESLSGGLDLTYTTIMVHRKHLPDGRLVAPYFPLLIHPESRAAMILPARYWPDEFVEEWLRVV